MSDVTGEEEQYTADQIAVFATSLEEFEKPLGVSKVENGTGKAQAAACVVTIDKLGLRANVRSLVFDRLPIRVLKLGRAHIGAATRPRTSSSVIVFDGFQVCLRPHAGPETTTPKSNRPM